MPIYKVNGKDIEPLEKTSFEREGLLERQHMQAGIRDCPEILEQGLYILAEEFGDWEESNRRIDLLALDTEGRLVVVELKRSDQASLMDLQAIRYAAMVSNMTLEQATEAHRTYLEAREQDPTDAASRIQQQLTGDDAEVEIDSNIPRIILASASFSKELTTSVLWLNQAGMDVTCVKLELYRSGSDLYMEGTRVIPLPEAEDYVTGVRARPRKTPPPTNGPGSTTLPGGAKFLEAAQLAQPSVRDNLICLHELAVNLETEGLASISTRVGSYNTVLRVRLPGSDQSLFYAYRNALGWGYLRFSGRNLERYAPRSKEHLELIIDRDIGPQSTLWDLPEGLLEALHAAYREAAGQQMDEDRTAEQPAEADPRPEAGEENEPDTAGA